MIAYSTDQWRQKAGEAIAAHLGGSQEAIATLVNQMSERELDAVLGQARSPNPVVGMGAVVYRVRLRTQGRPEANAAAEKDAQRIAAENKAQRGIDTRILPDESPPKVYPCPGGCCESE